MINLTETERKTLMQFIEINLILNIREDKTTNNFHWIADMCRIYDKLKNYEKPFLNNTTTITNEKKVLKEFPNAKITELCAIDLGLCDEIRCDDFANCTACWNQTYKGDK